jgi:acyl-CoA dehydrogenase
MDFGLSDIQIDIKRAAREFAEGEFTKIAQECDRAENLSDMSLLQKARDLGFVGIFINEQYGGMGLGFLETALVMEEFWRVDPGIGSQVMCMSFGSEMIMLFGRSMKPLRHGARIFLRYEGMNREL